MSADNAALDSIVHGRALRDEVGIGPLTIPVYLREVTSRYSEREALVSAVPPKPPGWKA